MNTHPQSFPPLTRIPIFINQYNKITSNNNRNKKAIFDKLYKVTNHEYNPEENRHEGPNIKVKNINPKAEISIAESKNSEFNQEISFKKEVSHLRKEKEKNSESKLSTFCLSKSVILIPKPTEEANILCKLSNFTDNYVTKYNRVLKEPQIVHRNLIKELEILNNESKMASTVCTKSLFESACNLTFNTKQEKNSNEIKNSLKECESIKSISFDPFQFPQPQPPKKITERWSLTRRVKTETSLEGKKYQIAGVNSNIQESERIHQAKQPARYSHRQLRPLPRTQTEKTITLKEKQPFSVILKENSETNLLSNSRINSMNLREENEEQKLKVIRQQLNQVYKNRPKTTSEILEKTNVGGMPSLRSGLNVGRSSYRDSMQEFYKSYLLQGRNQKFSGHENPFQGKV